MWPEVFVECAAKLSDAELHKFQDWLVNPQGEPTAPMLQKLDAENEALRKQLLKEACARDAPVTIDEHYMDVDDEKVDPEISMLVNLSMEDDFNMVDTFPRASLAEKGCSAAPVTVPK